MVQDEEKQVGDGERVGGGDDEEMCRGYAKACRGMRAQMIATVRPGAGQSESENGQTQRRVDYITPPPAFQPATRPEKKQKFTQKRT